MPSSPEERRWKLATFKAATMSGDMFTVTLTFLRSIVGCGFILGSSW